VLSEGEHGIINDGSSVRLEAVDPVVPDAVGKLLLLPEEHLLR
jgi:hypothetical protein